MKTQHHPNQLSLDVLQETTPTSRICMFWRDGWQLAVILERGPRFARVFETYKLVTRELPASHLPKYIRQPVPNLRRKAGPDIAARVLARAKARGNKKADTFTAIKLLIQEK